MSQVLSVQELNALVSAHLSTPSLQNVEVQGECSAPKLYSRGHFYFTLKDRNAAVSCVMFRSDVARHQDLPTGGTSIICRGRIGLYERDGRYQLYVRSITKAGQGELWQKFQELKERLDKAGYFAAERKKTIPFLPKTIGIVTSGQGAAVKDIIQVSRRRFPNMNLQLIPVRVQGDEAAREIARAIKVFNVLKQADVLIVGRGGGSLEDLWAFNEEIVAKAILASEIPVISAVGHEVDFSISDFVADLRAPTPSAAAELAVPVKSELETRIKNLSERLTRASSQYLKWKEQRLVAFSERLVRGAQRRLDNEELRLDKLANHPVFYSPLSALELREQKLTHWIQKLYQYPNTLIERKKREVSVLYDKLNLLSPWQVLERGYAAVREEDGGYITKACETKPGDVLQLLFVDGSVTTEVSMVNTKKYNNKARKDT